MTTFATNDYDMAVDTARITRGLVVGDRGTDIATTWSTYTPTIGATTTAPTLGTVVSQFARFQVIGKVMFLQMTIDTSSAAAAGTGTYLFPLPSGYTFVAPGSGVTRTVGYGFVRADAVNNAVAVILSTLAATNVQLVAFRDEADAAGAVNISATNYDTNTANGVKYTFNAVIEIA